MLVGFDNSIAPGFTRLDRQSDQVARIYREAPARTAPSMDFYIGETLSKGRLTVDLGVRYDRQWGAALPSATQSNGAFPNVVPGIVFAGYDTPFTFNDVSPRAGITWALDDSRRTIVRANYSRYAGQLDTPTIGYMNPSSNAGFADYGWKDLNGDQLVQPDEVDFTEFVAPGGGFNPAAPTSVRSANVIDPDLDAPITQSLVSGVDRQLAGSLAIQVNYSWTRTHNYMGSGVYNPWVGLTANDYNTGALLTGTLPNGQTFSVQTYTPIAALVAANGNSRILTNWDGYSSRYNGIEVSLVKRLSNRWMVRIGGSINAANEMHDQNPPRNNFGNPTPVDTEPLKDGGPFVVRSAASGAGDYFIHGKWQLSANGMYVMPCARLKSAPACSAVRDIRSPSTSRCRSGPTVLVACSSRPSSTRFVWTTSGTSTCAPRARSDSAARRSRRSRICSTCSTPTRSSCATGTSIRQASRR